MKGIVNSVLWVVVLSLTISSCRQVSALPDGYSLLAPKGLNQESRSKNIRECQESASLQAWTNPPLTGNEKISLDGRPTVKFFRQGVPVVSKDLTPTIYRSFIDPPGGYTSPEVSDRYVLCLMNRGYTWPRQLDE
jgi:hypothetical protein